MEPVSWLFCNRLWYQSQKNPEISFTIYWIQEDKNFSSKFLHFPCKEVANFGVLVDIQSVPARIGLSPREEIEIIKADGEQWWVFKDILTPR
jgi:hypothetical protein